MRGRHSSEGLGRLLCSYQSANSVDIQVLDEIGERNAERVAFDHVRVGCGIVNNHAWFT